MVTHFVGDQLTQEEVSQTYQRMQEWRASDGLGPMWEAKKLFDSSWTETFRTISHMCQRSETRPDFLIADYLDDAAARDIMHTYNIQIAVVWPQMPPFLAPVSYIPGEPGLQVDITLTSEHASLTSRIRNAVGVFRELRAMTTWLKWTRTMRSEAGMHHLQIPDKKPHHLVLVNSFFGLEVPKDLPPLMAAVGPLLDEEYPPLQEPLLTLLNKRKQVLYISLGTHIFLSTADLEKLMTSCFLAIDLEYVDGIVWSLPKLTQEQFSSLKRFPRMDGSYSLISDILKASAKVTASSAILPEIFITSWAPQRAVLEHPSTKLSLTHAGGSSANETVFHGVPALTLAFFHDQLFNAERLRQAGVGLLLDKFTFEPLQVAEAIKHLVCSEEVARNVLRMKKIARRAARRKWLAVDLIEEVMEDQILRFEDDQQRELRPMHLQTADARMSVWRARNLDIWAVGLLGVTAVSGFGWLAVRHGVRIVSSLGRHGRLPQVDALSWFRVWTSGD